MSRRSEQRSGVEDWRAAASEKESEPKRRFSWLVAVIVLLGIGGVVAWLAR